MEEEFANSASSNKSSPQSPKLDNSKSIVLTDNNNEKYFVTVSTGLSEEEEKQFDLPQSFDTILQSAEKTKIDIDNTEYQNLIEPIRAHFAKEQEISKRILSLLNNTFSEKNIEEFEKAVEQRETYIKIYADESHELKQIIEFNNRLIHTLAQRVHRQKAAMVRANQFATFSNRMVQGTKAFLDHNFK